MKIALYNSNRDREPACTDVDWSELAALLSEVKITGCVPDGSPWHVHEHSTFHCPHTVKGHYPKELSITDEHTDIFKGSDCPAKLSSGAWSPVDIIGTRLNSNVRAVTAAVFDLDHVTRDELLDVSKKVEGYDHIFHSTHNNRPQANDYALRLVMRLSRPVPAHEWPAVYKAAINHLDLPKADRKQKIGGVDTTCGDVSRLYFLPTAPSGSSAISLVGQGKPLDVDMLLNISSTPMPPIDTSSDTIADEMEPMELTTDLDTLRERLRTLRRRKAGSINPIEKSKYELLGQLLAGKSIADDGERDHMLNKVASMFAFCFPARTPVEAAVEIVRPSIAAMPHEPEGIGHWIDEFSDMYTRAMQRRVDLDARKVKPTSKKLLNTFRQPAPARATPARDANDEDEPNDTSDDDARDDLELDVDLDGDDPDAWRAHLIHRADGQIKACGENVVVILALSPETRGTLRWNEVEKSVEIDGGPFANVDPDDLPVAVTDWLTRKHGVSLGVTEVGARILRVARLNSYDPLASYLRSLEWDGVERCDRLLIEYMNARTTDAHGRDITKLASAVGRKWLISAVARALHPGSKVDTVLVLEGEEGWKKSSAFEVLGGKWYCTTQISLGDKDSKMLCASTWIVELAEMASLRRSEKEHQKAFLSARHDTYRQPYGRAIIKVDRRCVFVGTTNEDTYLPNDAKNRRYWCWYVEKKIDLKKIEDDRDQLWAEAVHRYLAGEEWWLTDQEEKLAAEQAAERVGESAIESKIARWWYETHPSKRPEFVTTDMISEKALKVTNVEDPRKAASLATEIGIATKRLGFRKARRMLHGRLSHVYIPTDEMLKAAQGPTPLHVVKMFADNSKEGAA